MSALLQDGTAPSPQLTLLDDAHTPTAPQTPEMRLAVIGVLERPARISALGGTEGGLLLSLQLRQPSVDLPFVAHLLCPEAERVATERLAATLTSGASALVCGTGLVVDGRLGGGRALRLVNCHSVSRVAIDATPPETH